MNWTWPVPFPKDAAEIAKRISTSGTGGGTAKCGDPEGPAPLCEDCLSFRLIWTVSFCAKTCAGYKKCTPAQSGCNLSPPKCATGSLLGNVAGISIY